MKYKLALCYLTHNHPSVMKEILDRCLFDYAHHGIDVCIYDDSDNDDTKNLIEKYISNGAENLYYVDAHMAKNGDHKLLLIFQGVGLPKEYDYIWPSKDRTCFSSSFLDKLCPIVDEGHDYVIGINERIRWDVGVNVFSDVYNDSVEFYRKYCSFTTNWEASIINTKTILKPINWEVYRNKYNVCENNNFNQTVILFARFSEMKKYSIKLCHYELNERFISNRATSNWYGVLFELWIDRWTAANFLLPSLYDDTKTEAIKTQTNLYELFGSVERMIEYHSSGIYNYEVFKKYKDTWKYISEIPIEVLEMIANNNYEGALKSVIADFEEAISNRNFEKAWWLLSANHWLDAYYDKIDKKIYNVIATCFIKYRRDMMEFGASEIFEGCNSIEDIMIKYLK